MGIEADLIAEIKKWSKRLDDSLLDIHPVGEEGEKMFNNIRAYRSDSTYFLERDPIKSFECLIWAWAILEVGRELGHLK